MFERLEKVETAVLLSGPNDVTIHRGAGATESQGQKFATY
jgi:hypothetical protein